MSYGQTVHALNARDALVKVAHEVMFAGCDVSPRGHLTREARHLTVVMDDPTDWSCADINANWSPRVAAVEALQLVGGFSDAAWAINHVPTLEPFTNSSGGFDGAYGPRIRDTLWHAVNRLQEDPDTRQAILPIYDARDTMRRSSKDYPCTLTLHFLVRDGLLDLDVSMRSNDVDWGFKHDVSQFCVLQCSVARLLNIQPGKYVHTSNSMHLYERSFEWARNLEVAQVYAPLDIPGGGLSSNGTVVDLQQRAWDIAHGVPLEFETETDEWFREAIEGD